MPMIESCNTRVSRGFSGITFSRTSSGWTSAVNFAIRAIEEGADILALWIDDNAIYIPVDFEDAHVPPRLVIEHYVMSALVTAGLAIREYRKSA